MLIALPLLLALVALVNLFRLRLVVRAAVPGKVSMVIPARNEEFRLPGCLLSAVFTSASEILVYDDGSEDGTANVVYSTMARYDRVRLIESVTLPEGWVGKAHACQRLADAAQGEWLLFLDAGARMSSQGVERLLAEAERKKLTWVTCWPRVELETFAQKLVVPAIDFVVAGFAPEILGQGPCTLVHRATYELLGGHAGFAGEVAADVALMREWRRRGERVGLFDGTGVVTVSGRMGFGELWWALRRQVFLAFPDTVWFVSVFTLAAVSMAPWWQAMAVVLVVRVVYAVRLRQPVWSAFLHPFAMAFLLAAAVASFWRRREVAWKGRCYRID